MGYTDIKYGFRIISDTETKKITEFRYLIKVEGVTPEHAIEISKTPGIPSDLDERVSESARVASILDEIGYPKGYIPEDYIEK